MNELLPPLTAAGVCSRIAAHAVLKAGPDSMAQLRRNPGPPVRDPIAVNFLKQSEDQTVLGLSAVLQAVARFGMKNVDFSAWGVVAAPVLFGREATAMALKKFEREGAWCISPHLIPHQSLHALSGTISQVLKVHGPNLGAGNSPAAAQDAFLIAATLLSDGLLPGVWLVLTGHEAEWVPAENGPPVQPPRCVAAALALQAAMPAAPGLCLRISPMDESNVTIRRECPGLAGEKTPQRGSARTEDAVPDFTLMAFAQELERPVSLVEGKWRLARGGWVELEAYS